MKSRRPEKDLDKQVFVKGMAHDEAVATQKTGKTASPPKDQLAPCPYPDWSTMQAYYGPGILPATYFTPGIAPGRAPPPYMWGPPPLMPPTLGTPYAAMYPHVGAYPHPLVPMMANPLSMEPAKSANSKEKSSNKKLKEIDGTAVSVGSGNSKKTMSSSGDYSAEGSSDVNDMKVSKTPRKRSLDDGPGAETAASAKMEDVLAPNHILENTAISPNHCFPAPVIKPSATNAANSRAMGTPICPTPGVMVSSHTGVSTELSIKDERELKREKRNQTVQMQMYAQTNSRQCRCMHPAVMLNGFTSHQLKLIQQVLRKNFRDLVYVCTFGEDDTSEKRVVYTVTNEDKRLLMKDVQEDLLRSRETRVKSAVGIRHVIDLLASERKLIVGHSCFLDIAQVYSKFVGPRPSSMKEFALGIHKIFPHIADTRHLMSVNKAVQCLMRQKRKSLSSAFSLLCPALYSPVQKSSTLPPVRVEVEADETTLSCFTSGAKHEAGYDAFMTGCVFAQLCSYLDIKFEHLSPEENLATNSQLQKHINLLSPCWNSGTVVDLSTGTERPDLVYKRRYPAAVYDNVVLIWGFQSNLRPKDIKDCICKVFGSASLTSIFSIDSTAVLIQFSKQESVNDFLDLKATLERTDTAISVLHPLSTILEGGQTRAAKYDTYRDICSSSVSKFFFADQAEAVCSTSKSQLKSVKPAEGTRSGSKNQDDNDISCQDILDALQDGKSSFGKRMRST